jgi:RimJ/RimL family protein N-acetyltransferase
LNLEVNNNILVYISKTYFLINYCKGDELMYLGKKIRLREYRKEDAIMALEYMNDPEIKKLLTPGIPFLYTLEDEQKWVEGISGTKDNYSFAIETLEDKKYIGGCGINNLDWKNSVFTIGIFIGDKEYLGKGYGTDAMKTLIKFIFEQMNINKIKLQVFSFNKRAVRSYEKCGFKKEGVLRMEIFRDGRYYDDIIMGLLREEYNELNKNNIP